jgi:hypothetical protein
MSIGSVPHNHVAIIGTGFGGIATAVRLQKAGFDDLVLLDRASDVGGVWRDNDYPGAVVDVQSHLYSFSFAPNPDWRSTFAKQPELQAYLRQVADQFDLRRRLVLECDVEELRWDPADQQWTLRPGRSPSRSSPSCPAWSGLPASAVSTRVHPCLDAEQHCDEPHARASAGPQRQPPRGAPSRRLLCPGKGGATQGSSSQRQSAALGGEQKRGERPDAGSIPVTPPRSPLTPVGD